MNKKFISRFEEYVFWVCGILLAVNAWLALWLSSPSSFAGIPRFITPYFFYIAVFLDPVMALLLLAYVPRILYISVKRSVRLSNAHLVLKVALYAFTFLLPFAWYGFSNLPPGL